MERDTLSRSMARATKWSAMAEIGAKLIAPITNMILARLLIPEMFGVVQTLTLVVSFAEIFTDAGFQKYLVQHDFKDEADLNLSTNVAFWTNLVFSVLLWAVIAVFADPIAASVGSEGRGMAVTVMSLQIPLLAFSSIQTARYRRDLDFKSLFFVRMITAMVPLMVTVPLAVVFRNYWALVAGNLSKDVLNAVLLTARSRWKPRLRYNLERLKEMLSFSMWTIVENITIWLTANVGTFIVGHALSDHYVGLYKTAISTVNGYMNILSASVMQVLFSGLSRCQNDERAFREVFFKFQRLTAILLLPLGFGMFVFRKLVVLILLGNQWLEVAGFLGMWSLTSALTVILSSMNSEVFRSKGKPRLSVLNQVLHLVVLVPVLLLTMDKGFKTLTVARSLVRFQGIAVSLIFLHVFMKIRMGEVFKNVFPSLLSAGVMALVGMGLLQIGQGIPWQLLSVALCVAVYFGCMLLLPAGRKTIMGIPAVRKYMGRFRKK